MSIGVGLTIPNISNLPGASRPGSAPDQINYRIELENLTSGSIEVAGLVFHSDNIINIDVPIQLINPPNILPNAFFGTQSGNTFSVGNNNFGITPSGSGVTIPGNTTFSILNITTHAVLTQFTFMGLSMSQVTDVNNQLRLCSTSLDGVEIETVSNAEFRANYITR